MFGFSAMSDCTLRFFLQIHAVDDANWDPKQWLRKSLVKHKKNQSALGDVATHTYMIAVYPDVSETNARVGLNMIGLFMFGPGRPPPNTSELPRAMGQTWAIVAW